MDKTYVLYIGIARIRDVEVDDYVRRIASKAIPADIDGTVIVIPTNNDENRLVCINPEYITNEELIKQNTMLLFELNYELNKQLNITKNEEKFLE